MLPEIAQCCGCGSCAAVCPQNCISMVADREGFRYPAIDATKCIRCRLCEKACPILSAPQVSERVTALAAQNKDETVRRRSSSGGVFSALAEYVTARGGSVCAAAYDARFEVRHVLIDSPEAIDALRGAKYAQSRTEQSFHEIRERLTAGQMVLFVGTPCQCAGLKAYLGRDFENLLTVDMVCHGVPSPKVWSHYLREQEREAGSKLRSVNLRSKSTGWSRYAYSVEMTFENGTNYSAPQGKDPFLQGFVRNLYLRPSCSACSFKGTARCSDLTLGDYWGIWDQHPEFDDDRGTSMLLLHSEKGRVAWQHISDNFRVLDVSVQDAVAQNPSAIHSSVPHPRREDFFHELGLVPVKQSIQHALELPKEGIIKRLIRRIGRK